MGRVEKVHTMADAPGAARPTATPTPNAPSPVPSATPPVPAAPAAPGSFKPEIAFDDFAKIDLRVATVVKAENHPNADKLLKLQVDDGSGTLRQICSGIRADYTAEQMVGKHIIIIANLAPRKIRGEDSRGMLLAASEMPKDAAAATPGVERKVILLQPEQPLVPGSLVS
jgi:methionyl-tRNA synthetase